MALDELEAAADGLGRVATEVGEVAVAVGLVGLDPRLQLAALTAPLEYLAVQRAVLTCVGPTGAAGLAVDVAATGVATRAAVRAYREGEQAVEALTLIDLPDAEVCCGFGGTFAIKNADTSTAGPSA